MPRRERRALERLIKKGWTWDGDEGWEHFIRGSDMVERKKEAEEIAGEPLVSAGYIPEAEFQRMYEAGKWEKIGEGLYVQRPEKK
ncbi:hypothetical protein ES708_06130 [subsurface metagenome]